MFLLPILYSTRYYVHFVKIYSINSYKRSGKNVNKRFAFKTFPVKINGFESQNVQIIHLYVKTPFKANTIKLKDVANLNEHFDKFCYQKLCF